MNCTTCRFEPHWKLIGRDSGCWEQLEGYCRRPRPACDRRELIYLDTEYMSTESVGGHFEDCSGWERKE